MIVVTGGMGFIGMHTVRALLDAGEQVVPTSHRAWRIPETWESEVGKRVFPQQLDIANAHDCIEVVRKYKATGIVHLAGPPFAGVTPANDYATNTGGLLNLLEAARVGELRRFVYASSNAVYGGIPNGPYDEEMTVPVASTNPISAYKKAGEILMFHYADRVGLSVAAVRPPAVYGPMYYSLMNMMSRFCHAAVKGTAPDYGAGGPPHADDAMDMAYVKDVAAIFARAATQQALAHRVYNCGAGREFSYQRLADAVKAVVPAAPVEVNPAPNPRPQPKDNYLDMARVALDLHYTPQYDIERGVAEYIDWLGTHPL